MPLTSDEKLQQELEKKIQDIQGRSREDAAKQLAEKLNLPYLDLNAFPISNDALILVDEAQARIAQIAVISRSGTKIQAAAAEPGNAETKKVIEDLARRKFIVSVAVVSLDSLMTAWGRYKTAKKTERVQLGIVDIKEEHITELQNKISSISDLQKHISGLKLSDIVDILVAGALKINASDIHLEPEEDKLRIRYRLDGVLSDIADIGSKDYPNLLSRIKLISGLKINIHDSPQDGRFTIRLKNKDVEVRVSILPGAYGENAVMRILDPETIAQNLDDLGMRPEALSVIKEELKKTTGAILTTGPTGSGKTTTLYAFLKHINEPGIKIITIEDPIEYHIKGISQTQVEPEKGYTFAEGLRSIVRQDPDTILVGEIRDKETAEIAIQAALTGHLVFSTLHTNDASGTIPRLIDLGVNPVNIAPALNLVMAQRLVRRLCQKCGEKKKISAPDLDIIKSSLSSLPANIKTPAFSESTEIIYPKGCTECNNTGYKGRVGIFELLLMDDEMEKLILKAPSLADIKEMAAKKGMLTMSQDGYLKVLDGITSVEEVMRVTS